VRTYGLYPIAEPHVVLAGGGRVTQVNYEVHGGYMCAHSGLYWLNTHNPFVLLGGAKWSPDSARDHAFVCLHDGEHHPLAEESVRYFGYAAKYDDAPEVDHSQACSGRTKVRLQVTGSTYPQITHVDNIILDTPSYVGQER